MLIAVYSYTKNCRWYFSLFKAEEDSYKFFEYIDTFHPNIRFTQEKETTLAFLDIKSKRANCVFETSVLLVKIYRVNIKILFL